MTLENVVETDGTKQRRVLREPDGPLRPCLEDTKILLVGFGLEDWCVGSRFGMVPKRVGISRIAWTTRSTRSPHASRGRATVAAGTTRSPGGSRTMTVGVLRIVIATRLVPRNGSGWVQGAIVGTTVMARVGRFRWPKGQMLSKTSGLV